MKLFAQWIFVTLVISLAGCGGSSTGPDSENENRQQIPVQPPDDQGESKTQTGKTETEDSDGRTIETGAMLVSPRYLYFSHFPKMTKLDIETGEAVVIEDVQWAREVYAVSEGYLMSRSLAYTTGKQVYAVSTLVEDPPKLIYATSSKDKSISVEIFINLTLDTIYEFVEVDNSSERTKYKTLLMSDGVVKRNYPHEAHNSPLFFASGQQPEVYMSYGEDEDGNRYFESEVFDLDFNTVWRSSEAYIDRFSAVNEDGKFILVLGFKSNEDHDKTIFRLYEVDYDSIKSGYFYPIMPIISTTSSVGNIFHIGNNFYLNIGDKIYEYISSSGNLNEHSLTSYDGEIEIITILNGKIVLAVRNTGDKSAVAIYDPATLESVIVGWIPNGEEPGIAGDNIYVNSEDMKKALVVGLDGKVSAEHNDASWVVGRSKDPLNISSFFSGKTDAPVLLIKHSKSASCDMCSPELWWVDRLGNPSLRLGQLNIEPVDHRYNWLFEFVQTGKRLALLVNNSIYVAHVEKMDSLRKITSEGDIRYIID